MSAIDGYFIRTQEMCIARKNTNALFFVIIAIAASSSSLYDFVFPGEQRGVIIPNRVSAQPKLGGIFGCLYKR